VAQSLSQAVSHSESDSVSDNESDNESHNESAHRPRRYSRTDTRGWMFVGPFLVVFALTFLAPIGYAAYLSVFRE
jgi:multiple sugar transport system permease protein